MFARTQLAFSANYILTSHGLFKDFTKYRETTTKRTECLPELIRYQKNRKAYRKGRICTAHYEK